MSLPNNNQICLPQKLAYSYIVIIILTLLAVGIFEWLNAKRIGRLMEMLEEVERNKSADNQNGGLTDDRFSASVGGTKGGRSRVK